MNILLPKKIAAAMLQAGTTIPAVDTAAGEVAWVTGTNYALGDRRVDGDYIYECVQALRPAGGSLHARRAVQKQLQNFHPPCRD